MSKYKINVTVNLVECDDDEKVNNDPIELEDGSYQFIMNDDAGESIDDCEIGVLKTAFPSIRKAIAQHMEELSKKKL